MSTANAFSFGNVQKLSLGKAKGLNNWGAGQTAQNIVSNHNDLRLFARERLEAQKWPWI